MYLAVLLGLIGLVMHIWGPDDELDIKFFYTSVQANNFLQGLSASQAGAYLLNEIMDLLFLSTYSLLFFFLARRFYFRKTWMALVPGFFDLIETTTIIFLLINRSWAPPHWLGYATSLKWTTGIILAITILVGFARQLKQASNKTAS